VRTAAYKGAVGAHLVLHLQHRGGGGARADVGGRLRVVGLVQLAGRHTASGPAQICSVVSRVSRPDE
jgi:hypothetical protein